MQIEITPRLYGKKHGLCHTFNSTGRLVLLIEYLDATEENWNEMKFSPAGTLVQRMPFRKAMRCGTSHEWNDQGILLRTQEWKENMLNGLSIEWYPTGEKKRETLWAAGVSWDETGDRVAQEPFVPTISSYFS